MVGLSEGEKHFIRGGIAQDLRTDGRRRLQFRAISVETGVIPQANGSARVRLGATEVIATVKDIVQIEVDPAAAAEINAKLTVAVQIEVVVVMRGDDDGEETRKRQRWGEERGCGDDGRGRDEPCGRLSWGNQAFFILIKGKFPFLLIVAQLQHPCLRVEVLKNFLLSSVLHCKDAYSVVKVGQVCWDLYIDGLVVSSDGNLLDALAGAIKVALSDTGIPKVNVSLSATTDEEPEVDVSDEEFLQFDTSSVPVIVTLTKVGKHYIVDATSEEESQMSSAVSVSVNRHGQICGLTKRGGAGLDPSVIFDMISVAKHVSRQFISVLDSEILAAEAAG
ncbi:hypothetical protein OsI_38058 [Oryza sativa Indica Group]|uniref:Ribosomal RNA-processing protein 42 n=1 Tax=Oryza sativa subsp. indica TaxID=39946 RepID=B8BP86_ORYSI|nr:hypothetical protein OsI_38058 [Oryza sativa Indica Group]